jgi:hypothetical protein
MADIDADTRHPTMLMVRDGALHTWTEVSFRDS